MKLSIVSRLQYLILHDESLFSFQPEKVFLPPGIDPDINIGEVRNRIEMPDPHVWREERRGHFIYWTATYPNGVVLEFKGEKGIEYERFLKERHRHLFLNEEFEDE